MGQDRLVKGTFNIRLRGYIIPDVIQKDLNAMKKKHKVKNIVVPGLEWMSDIKEQSVNEARLDPQQLLQQLGGNRFIMMVGAKNLVVDKSKNELHMKIGRNAKGVSHVRIRLSSMDLYDMEFLQVRAGKIKIKSKFPIFKFFVFFCCSSSFKNHRV